ncbi:inositol monophosphatase family protein [Rhizobium sp. BR 314]|uniref:inositol monophosphatase family protein n=1 Tax=Rhizobium sp. BR 314 TaxID=3040013 RepID=UPI0039BED560
MRPASDVVLPETRAEYCGAIIRAAGDLVLEGFHAGVGAGLSMKGPQDYLTETDAASEALIREGILARFPDDSFFGEEGGGAIGERVWVVDPVDGTANFARGIPHFCISIAYVEKGVTEFGAVYNPALNEFYFAERGRGASLNGKAIRVAATNRYDATTIEMGWSTRVANETYLDVVKGMLNLGTNVRRAGSGALALAYVADGRLDGYVELHMNSWDCLAGLLLVSEAGGDVCPFLDIGSLEKGGPVLAVAPAIAAGISEIANIPLSSVGNRIESACRAGQ